MKRLFPLYALALTLTLGCGDEQYNNGLYRANGVHGAT